MNILITVCARGGSKGVPNKNIKNLLGRPLIYYTLSLINELKENNAFKNCDVVLSTDSKDIKEVVSEFDNANIELNYTRPEYLATDQSGKLEAIVDVKNFMSEKYNKTYDYTIDLDVSSPLRTAKDIFLALEKLKNNTRAFNIFSVNVANKNPYFNMVEETKDGFCNLCKKGEFLSRQEAPQVFEMNASFYIYKDSFFNQNYKTVITNYSIVFEMEHVCFDIDHPIDFDFMEYLLKNNKLDFKFNL
ncbi:MULTISPECIES: cytidylyltransferase domain-containing protein [unclassified Polaribacter]|uniref:acylneuraminate cytidylyltransferase family protein n=1 Tax=unclassified Polaribacter TaxID=196858 RepID=UPI0011BFCD59|nr:MULTISPECIES: acylneuraminate cytidylyltransferase family protein [unclassified Polaribacter]TXD50342.1 acylneuraminate cytidylyltransferase family protein [Polaribacter sp. IC063]TXD57187.1 acylneuraminate cytidylyltransferase family protein [Polaribacter sp. IC066]